jgi:CBS domain-containing protein
MNNVRQILERKGSRVVSLGKDAPVLDAVRLMAEHHIGAVLVMEGGQLLGIASERPLLWAPQRNARKISPSDQFFTSPAGVRLEA